MVDTANEQKVKAPLAQRDFKPKYLYDEWMESQGIPVTKGYYVEDLRTVEVGWWEARQHKAGFVQLMGQEGVNEVRISEIDPGASLQPFKFALDEICYVTAGHGVTTVWDRQGGKPHTFEWQPHSMFMIPRNWIHQHVNMRGDQPAARQRPRHLAHDDLLRFGHSIRVGRDFSGRRHTTVFRVVFLTPSFFASLRNSGISGMAPHMQNDSGANGNCRGR